MLLRRSSPHEVETVLSCLKKFDLKETKSRGEITIGMESNSSPTIIKVPDMKSNKEKPNARKWKHVIREEIRGSEEKKGDEFSKMRALVEDDSNNEMGEMLKKKKG